MSNPTEDTPIELLEESKQFDLKAREIVKGLGFAFDKAHGRRFVDEAIAESDILAALREARREGMMEAAGIARHKANPQRRACCFATAHNVAQAIERAAKEG